MAGGTTFDPVVNAGTAAGGAVIRALGSNTTPHFIGGGSDVTIRTPAPVHMPFGDGTIQAPGYVNGDQVKLLPNNADDLRTLQLSLIQAGYITQAQANRMVLGSPDQITSGAFARLLATANYSGTEWRSALATRLAAAAQQAPAEDTSKKVPPLTVQLSDPADIKATLQKSAQSLLGGYMSDDQANAFVAQFQNAQRQQQTQAYYQQYDPNGGAKGTGSYGPGGTTTAAPDLGVAAENYAKTTDPNQYQATQIGAGVSTALDKLRTTGYL